MTKRVIERVALYARVSTDMQAQGGKSIAAQIAEMHEFAKGRQWAVTAEFVDPGFSGTNMDRPGLQALLTAAEERAYDVMLVHELSRLSRRIYDTFRIFETLGTLDIGFASVKEPNFDFSTPTGRLFLTIMAALNQYYVDLLKMHTAKSKRQRAREGLYNASIPPFGYEHVGDSNTPPAIVEAEAEAVRALFERYAAGRHSYNDVAQWLNDAGYRTRTGRRFSKDTVADMVRNPFYKGFVAYRAGSRDQSEAEIYPGQQEAIVSPELWERCHRIRKKRKAAPCTYQAKYRVYLLNGIVTCDACGRKLRATGNETHRYYREMSSQRGFVDCPSAHTGVRVEVIDEQVGAIFRRLRLPEDWQARLSEMIKAGGDDRQVVERRRARLVAERKRLKRMKIQGEFDEDPQLYDDELARIRRQLDELPSPDALHAIEQAATVLEELAQIWDETELVDRRDLLRMAVREVKVDVPQGRVATIEPYPMFVPLFRQVNLVREVAFGVFAPRWLPGQGKSPAGLEQLPACTALPDRGACPDWPLVCTLPRAVVGQRITPALSDWLKVQRKAGRDPAAGRVIDLARPGVPPLKVDGRKWPGVAIQRFDKLGEVEDESALFLWTPFALQRVESKEAFVEEARRVLAPGGRWAFVDLMPASMPDHWLYRLFPDLWHDELKATWDASRMYNVLLSQDEAYQVELERRTVRQAVTLGVACTIARKRESCPQLLDLSDAAYGAGLRELERGIEQQGVNHPIEAAYCLTEVTVTQTT